MCRWKNPYSKFRFSIKAFNFFVLPFCLRFAWYTLYMSPISFVIAFTTAIFNCLLLLKFYSFTDISLLHWYFSYLKQPFVTLLHSKVECMVISAVASYHWVHMWVYSLLSLFNLSSSNCTQSFLITQKASVEDIWKPTVN